MAIISLHRGVLYVWVLGSGWVLKNKTHPMWGYVRHKLLAEKYAPPLGKSAHSTIIPC